jgi:hypothetical protein
VYANVGRDEETVDRICEEIEHSASKNIGRTFIAPFQAATTGVATVNMKLIKTSYSFETIFTQRCSVQDVR